MTNPAVSLESITRPSLVLFLSLGLSLIHIYYAILGNGLNPAGYHWINVALHAANVWMVYALSLIHI